MAKVESSSLEAPSKPTAIIIIDTLIVLTIIAALIYTYGFNTQLVLKIIAAIMVITAIGLYAFQQTKKQGKQEVIQEKINKIVLLDEDGDSIKEWYIQGVTSFLIGKNSIDREVDIDLTGVEYASLISNEHAVLNSYSGSWFIEDINSEHGVGIRKNGERLTKRLDIDEPYELQFGDTIFIANTRLLVK